MAPALPAEDSTCPDLDSVHGCRSCLRSPRRILRPLLLRYKGCRRNFCRRDASLQNTTITDAFGHLKDTSDLYAIRRIDFLKMR